MAATQGEEAAGLTTPGQSGGGTEASRPTAGQDPAADWANRRREAAAEHARRLEQRHDAETVRARALIARFLQTAPTEAREPVPLVVQGYRAGSARTPLVGWYLRADRTVGLSTAGEFYVLTAPLTLLDRMRGVRPRPSDPPLVIGLGGKDGESLDLAEALTRLHRA